MGSSVHWDESEIAEIVRSRSCLQGIEYLIIWKNGERPTWELRDSFFSKKLFDEFDRKALQSATDWAPIFNAEQKLIKNKYDFRKRNNRASKNPLQNSTPLDVIGIVEVNGTKFAIVDYYDTRQLVQWDKFKNDHPKMAGKFAESRCLKDILTN